jgi:UDP-glucose:tetrahydrobiopterin glucosyltransferase
MVKILFLSTSVGALGSGAGGGVELTVQNLAQELSSRGHQLEIVAPQGSCLADLTVTNR